MVLTVLKAVDISGVIDYILYTRLVLRLTDIYVRLNFGE